MYVVSVTIHVKPEHVDEFIWASLDNAKNTRLEPGNLRFDVLQGEDDKSRFLLHEVYKTKDDFAKHQQNPHYFRWRDAVTPWMAENRTAVKLHPVFYGDHEVAAAR
jgi:autoinducer 2-degrading protein